MTGKVTVGGWMWWLAEVKKNPARQTNDYSELLKLYIKGVKPDDVV